MNYDKLTLDYWISQSIRIEQSRAAIEARGDPASIGRVVPGESDLVFGSGRRLNMAVMFLDLSGFSSRASETLMEQDLLLRVLTLFFTEMVRIAEDYGGTVEKNTGDGVMVYFEDQGSEHSAHGTKRAVSCALTMQHTTAAAINPIVVNSGVESLSFRVGIEYGAVTIAKLGAARRFGSLVAIGTTANIASKMLDVAGPNEILLGHAAVSQLPLDWQLTYCAALDTPSGWFYRSTGLPYPFYRYTGRWTKAI